MRRTTACQERAAPPDGGRRSDEYVGDRRRPASTYTDNYGLSGEEEGGDVQTNGVLTLDAGMCLEKAGVVGIGVGGEGMLRPVSGKMRTARSIGATPERLLGPPQRGRRGSTFAPFRSALGARNRRRCTAARARARTLRCEQREGKETGREQVRERGRERGRAVRWSSCPRGSRQRVGAGRPGAHRTAGRHGARADGTVEEKERGEDDRGGSLSDFYSFCIFPFSIKTSSTLGILLRPLTILENYETFHRGSP